MRRVGTKSFQSPFSDISSWIEPQKSWGKKEPRLRLAGMDSVSSMKLVSRERRRLKEESCLRGEFLYRAGAKLFKEMMPWEKITQKPEK